VNDGDGEIGKGLCHGVDLLLQRCIGGAGCRGRCDVAGVTSLLGISDTKLLELRLLRRYEW
jgi:hypothetical protein